jgi:hypothetical protein
MHPALKFDGMTTQAYWQARTENVECWQDYIQLPLIRTLDLETQLIIWKLLGHNEPSEPEMNNGSNQAQADQA